METVNHSILGSCHPLVRRCLIYSYFDGQRHRPDRSLTIFITFLLLLTSPSYPSPVPSHRDTQIQIWATFLGVTSALLAALQYAPQLVHTYKSKLVGALSIKMMCIQSPGALLMVLSIALRPGTNWTSTHHFLDADISYNRNGPSTDCRNYQFW